jgi:hypothetical protein
VGDKTIKDRGAIACSGSTVGIVGNHRVAGRMP